MNRRLRAILLPLLALLALWAAPALAVQATGVGVDRDHALNNALQIAVETEIGVQMQSRTMVENFVVIRDDIVSHAKGYVSSYTVLSEKKETDGSYTINVEAVVNAGKIGSDIETLEILQKMAGHPRVLIFGEDDDFGSVSAGTAVFEPLVHKVAEVFAESFRFEVVDWATAKATFKDIPGKMTRESAIKHNKELRCQYLVTVKLNKGKTGPAGTPLTLIMDAVRVSDALRVSHQVREREPLALGASDPEADRRAVAVAEDAVFQTAVDVAKDMVASIQGEVERGEGLRFTLGFYDFPDQERLIRELGVVSGYVRHEVERSGGANLVVAYWSNLKAEQLAEQIKAALDKDGYKYQFKLDGRNLKFKWVNPAGF